MRRLASVFLIPALLCLAFVPASAQDPNDADITDIQNLVYASGTTVTIDSAVVTCVAPFGLYIQEPDSVSQIRSGIWCYNGSQPSVSVGDLVTLTGNYVEYFGVSEIDIPAASGSVTNLGPAPVVPIPADVRCQDVQTGGPFGEDWEGVLIRVDSVRVTDITLGFGEYEISEIDGDSTSVNDTLRVDTDRSIDGPPIPALSTVLKSLTGVLDYTFSDFKVVPRDIDDLDFPLPAPNVSYAYARGTNEVFVQFDVPMDSASVVDRFNYFFNSLGGGEFPASASTPSGDKDGVILTTTTAMTGNNPVPEILDVSGVQNADGTPMGGIQSASFIAGVSTPSFVQTSFDTLGSSQVEDTWCTITGIVTRDNSTDYNQRYYVEEPGGDSLSGIFVFDRIFPVVRGDSLTLAGFVLEFSGKTEIDDPTFLVNHGPAVGGIPGPDTVSIVQVNDPTPVGQSESWEGAFVVLKNVTVAEPPDAFGEWRVVQGGGTDTLVVGDDGSYTYTPFAGHEIGLLRGCMDYAFGLRLLQPGNDDDIINVFVGVDDEIPAASTTTLYPNRPNPFNPSTEIRYRLLENTRVQLRVYDARGGLVKTLVDRVQQGGQSYSVTWDGTDASGSPVASGVYFYSLQVKDRTYAKKMVLLK
jgi:hypothetical protein